MVIIGSSTLASTSFPSTKTNRNSTNFAVNNPIKHYFDLNDNNTLNLTQTPLFKPFEKKDYGLLILKSAKNLETLKFRNDSQKILNNIRNSQNPINLNKTAPRKSAKEILDKLRNETTEDRMLWRNNEPTSKVFINGANHRFSDFLVIFFLFKTNFG